MKYAAIAWAAAVLAAVSPASGQGRTQMREVGSSIWSGSGFRGTLGSNALDSFRTTAGDPFRRSPVGGTSYGPLTPPSSPTVGTSRTGGLYSNYMINPQSATALPARPQPGSGGTGYSSSIGRGFTGPSNLGSSDLSLPYYGSDMAIMPDVSRAGAQMPVQPSPRRTPVGAPVVDFDLAGQTAENGLWRHALELIGRGEFAESARKARSGLTLSSARPEGEWLLAISAAAAGDYSGVMFRLRNSLGTCPALLSQTAGQVSKLTSRQTVQNWLTLAMSNRPSDRPAPAEQLLSAAWLAADLGDDEQARSLVLRAGESAGPARLVAVALRNRLSLPEPAATPAQTPAAAGPQPQPPAAAASISAPAPATAAKTIPAQSFDSWMNSPTGQSLGAPPPAMRSFFGRLDKSAPPGSAPTMPK